MFAFQHLLKKETVPHEFATDPRAFLRGDEFIPERWTTQPELVRDRTVYAPFSVGKCPVFTPAPGCL
jgi:hypothetical protein